MPGAASRARGGVAAAATTRKRSRSAAYDVPAGLSDEDDADEVLGGSTPNARTARLSPGDTRGIAEAIFQHSKPLMLSEWSTIAGRLEEQVLLAVKGETAKLVTSDGELAALVRCLVREELDAFAERQPKMDATLAGVKADVREAVVNAIKTTPAARSADQMTKAEVCAAIGTAVGYKKLRDLLPEVLSRRVVAIAKDDSDLHDVTTISFPAASKKRKSYANTEFDKIVKSLVHKLYEQNAMKPEEQRPPVLRKKVRLLVHDMDMVDELITAAARVALHDGRSEARKLFFRLFAFFLMTPDACMELQEPGAAEPPPGARASAPYYAVGMCLRASANGVVGDGEGTHVIKRVACLYDIAAQILQGIVMQPYPFDDAVVDAFARNLRHMLTSDDRTWTTTPMKEAEAVTGPGSWALLLPMLDCRVSLSKEVQTLKPSEKYLLRSNTAPDSSVSADAGTATDKTASASTSDAPAQPSWL